MLILRITEQIACSENVSRENFRGKRIFESISIVVEACCYKLLLEQQLVANVIFLCLILLWQQDVTWSLEREAVSCWQQG